MEYLFNAYGITEHDFISADLSFVPALTARDIGFDRSLIGAYGHDDRVCSYSAFQAILKVKAPEKTAVCLLADKEEIGSEGTTGNAVAFLRHAYGGSVRITKRSGPPVHGTLGLPVGRCCERV